MSEVAGTDLEAMRRLLQSVAGGAVPLSEERLRILAPQWEAMFRSLRQMDQLDLEECEPAGLFVWRVEQ